MRCRPDFCAPTDSVATLRPSSAWIFSRTATVRGSPKRAYSISNRSLTPSSLGVTTAVEYSGLVEAQVADLLGLGGRGGQDAQGTGGDIVADITTPHGLRQTLALAVEYFAGLDRSRRGSRRSKQSRRPRRRNCCVPCVELMSWVRATPRSIGRRGACPSVDYRDQAILAASKRVAFSRDAENVDPGRNGAALAVAAVPLIGLVTGRGGRVADEGDPVAS